MLECVAIALSGALGGFTATVVADRGKDAVVQKLLTEGRGPWLWEPFTEMMLNIFGGGMASVVLWAVYTNSPSFSASSISPAEVGTAVIAGFGGVGAIRRLVRQSEDVAYWKQTAVDSSKATLSFVRAVEEQESAAQEMQDTQKGQTARAPDPSSMPQGEP